MTFRSSIVLVSLTLALPAASSGAATSDHGYASPRWSPDGTKVAYVAWRIERRPSSFVRYGALYTMNADGSGARVVVPETAWLGKPSWAPDGRRIAFCICDVSDGGIDVVNIDGTGRRRLDRDAHSPAWSPGGRKIAFVEPALDDDEGDVVVMNTDGTDKRVAAGVDDEVAWLDPAWSPDGEKLSFVATDAPDTGSYVVPYLAYTTNWHAEPPRVRLLSHAQAWAADWAPDGHHILFSYNGALRVLDLRTQRTTFLHDGVAGDWSPDGRRIVFADRDGDLHTMSAHGTDVRSLVPR